VQSPKTFFKIDSMKKAFTAGNDSGVMAIKKKVPVMKFFRY